MSASNWKNRIELAAYAGRRSSVELLGKLIWNESNTQVLGVRPHTNSLSTSAPATTFYQPPRRMSLSKRKEEDEEEKIMITDDNEDSGGAQHHRQSAAITPQPHHHSSVERPTNGDLDGQTERDNLVEPMRGPQGLGRNNGGRVRQAVIVPMSRTSETQGPGMMGFRRGERNEDRGNAKLWKSHGNHSMGLVLSALYAKLLVVMGMAFPLSEVMSTYIPAAYYDGFYLYLYFVSIFYMIWVFGYIVRQRARRSARVLVQGMHSFRIRKQEAIEAPPSPSAEPTPTPTSITPIILGEDKSSISDLEDGDLTDGTSSIETPPISPEDPSSGIPDDAWPASSHLLRKAKGAHFGSFYLRMGAVAFGVGSMIYSGLEFGQYFELKSDTRCHNMMMALTPSVRMIFTFMQMYFIFLSSRMAVFKESLSSQFGLMHMIGTNLCVWLNVLVQETKHEILSFYDPDNKTISFKSVRAHQQFSGSYHTPKHSSSAESLILESGGVSSEDDVFYDTSNFTSLISESYDEEPSLSSSIHHRVTRGLKGPYSIHECGRTNIIGSIVQDAAPFLFPCTIEYSLICAAICYVIWKSHAQRKTAMIVHKHSFRRPQLQPKTYASRTAKSPHHYTVDCAASHKGLFLGIFVLVLTIMSLIINFVLVKHPDYRVMANLEAHITEIVLYTMATCAVIIGMCQIRALRYSHGRNLELDNILLIVAQTGSLIFNIFAIISGQFIFRKGENLVLVTALLKVIQLLLQTLFILDASKRAATTLEQVKKKPGREVVTFLLITNLAMWLINALEKSRGESHPAQLQFYGVWAWTIITHISMPLAIFYRFHSTVCLCEIWKRAYKMKH